MFNIWKGIYNSYGKLYLKTDLYRQIRRRRYYLFMLLHIIYSHGIKIDNRFVIELPNANKK